MKENIWENVAVGWSSGSQVEVQETVIVDVAEVRTHGIENAIQASFDGRISKCTVSFIVVELEGFHVVGKTKLALQVLLRRHVIAGHKQIRKAVIIVVEEPGREAHPGCLYACLLTNLRKGAVVIVVVEEIVAAEI